MRIIYKIRYGYPIPSVTSDEGIWVWSTEFEFDGETLSFEDFQVFCDTIQKDEYNKNGKWEFVVETSQSWSLEEYSKIKNPGFFYVL